MWKNGAAMAYLFISCQLLLSLIFWFNKFQRSKFSVSEPVFEKNWNLSRDLIWIRFSLFQTGSEILHENTKIGKLSIETPQVLEFTGFPREFQFATKNISHVHQSVILDTWFWELIFTLTIPWEIEHWDLVPRV